MGPEHLTYYPDSAPGITRHRAGRGFSYRAPDGTTIDDKTERKRIAALAVPPAYENVWISPRVNGHLQATGQDARKRKQYRYHPDWRAYREARKFDDLAQFGAALPVIRRRIDRDLNGEAGDQDFAIAAVLALIDRAAVRIGTPEYAAENGTFGATTLRPRHLRWDGEEVALSYTAKGGQKVRKTLSSAKLNRVLGRLHDLPGAELITWIDDDGAPRRVSSEQVNARLQDLAEHDGVTAKTFRTWAGSAAALTAAMQDAPVTIKALSEAAAERLHNTPSIARNSYIHPKVVALTEMDGDARLALREEAPDVRGLRRDEAALLHLLQAQ